MDPQSSEDLEPIGREPRGSDGQLVDPASGALGDWIHSARAGSDEAFGKLAACCYRYLVLVANRELGEDLRAKLGGSDLVQETLVAARGWPRHTPCVGVARQQEDARQVSAPPI